MQSTPKILLVDDNADNLKALEVVLRDLNVDIVKATSGNDALKATLHHDFALALLDVQMPEMDGYELANILKTEERTENLPFIFISAVYTDHHNISEGYTKGAYNFFAKPFDPETLVRSVALFLTKHQDAEKQAELGKRLEERAIEIDKKNAELERMNTELQSFVYIASHDLQEPLRKIHTYTDILLGREKGSMSETALNYVTKIQTSVSRGQLLITDLLTYSKTNDVDLIFSLTNLNEMLRSVEDDFSEILNEKKAKINTDALPEMNVIPFQIRQVFQNLISNSLKYSSEKRPPRIKISCETIQAKKAIDVDLSPNTDYWHITFNDNGIGFEAQYEKKIFEMFQRLHGRTEYSGTGIGLAIVKKIIDNHKGAIRASSVVGQGSTFDIYLPKETL